MRAGKGRKICRSADLRRGAPRCAQRISEVFSVEGGARGMGLDAGFLCFGLLGGVSPIGVVEPAAAGITLGASFTCFASFPASLAVSFEASLPAALICFFLGCLGSAENEIGRAHV